MPVGISAGNTARERDQYWASVPERLARLSAPTSAHNAIGNVSHRERCEHDRIDVPVATPVERCRETVEREPCRHRACRPAGASRAAPRAGTARPKRRSSRTRRARDRAAALEHDRRGGGENADRHERDAAERSMHGHARPVDRAGRRSSADGDRRGSGRRVRRRRRRKGGGAEAELPRRTAACTGARACPSSCSSRMRFAMSVVAEMTTSDIRIPPTAKAKYVGAPPRSAAGTAPTTREMK